MKTVGWAMEGCEISTPGKQKCNQSPYSKREDFLASYEHGWTQIFSENWEWDEKEEL
jgi:hypothetical protein